MDPALWRNCLKELIVAHLTQPISLFIVYPFAVYMGGTLAVDALPSWSQILWQVRWVSHILRADFDGGNCARAFLFF